MRAALSLRCGCVAQTRRLRFIPPYSPGTLAPVVMRHCGRFGTVSKTVDGRKVVRGSNPSPSATDRNFRRLLVFCASGDRSAGGALASTNVSERPLCGTFIPPPFPRDRWRLHEQPAAAERLHERDRRRSRPGTSLPLVPRLAPPTLAIVAARLQRTAKRRLRLGPRLRIDSRPQGCRFDSYTAHRDRRESPATAGFLMPAPRLSVRRTAGGSTPRSTERARCVLDSLPPAVRAEARTRQPAPSRRPRRNGAESKASGLRLLGDPASAPTTRRRERGASAAITRQRKWRSLCPLKWPLQAQVVGWCSKCAARGVASLSPHRHQLQPNWAR
jgi:hypothetical protein